MNYVCPFGWHRETLPEVRKAVRFFPAMTRRLRLAAAGFLIGLVPGSWALDDTPEAIEDLIAIQDKVQKALPLARAATVGIIASDGTGSGVVVSEDGLVMTAGHVSGKPGQEIIVVFEDGKRVKARSLGRTALSDAGLARILEKGKWPAAPIIGDKEEVDVGDWVFSLGHPGGFDGARGTVFRYGRIIRVRASTLQSDCKLQGGDSGGPLFDLEGNVIGIHSRIWKPMDHNFHVSVGAFRSSWDEMLDGKVVRGPGGEGGGFLGAGTTDHEDGGVLVEQVIPGSAAAEGGVKLGDVILKIAGKEIGDTDEFSKAIRGKEAGDEVEIQLLRENKKLTLTVTLGRKPGW